MLSCGSAELAQISDHGDVTTCNNRSYPEKASNASTVSHRDTSGITRCSSLHHPDSGSRTIPCNAILGVVTVQTSQCYSTQYVFACTQTEDTANSEEDRGFQG